MANDEHWYDRDGNSMHRIVGANGKERATTIRDARKLGLYPSVTTVLGVLAKRELDEWKARQITAACYAHHAAGPLAPDWDHNIYHAEMTERAFKQVDDAADLGTRIHAAIEAAFTSKPWDPALEVYIRAVNDWVQENGIAFLAHELRLVNPLEGYAGTTDADVRKGDRRGILDFKSRKTKPGFPCEPWSGQAAQIAAYHVARFGTIEPEDFGVNVFISTTEPGRIEAAWYDADTLAAEWRMFQHACAIWQHLRKYHPGQQVEAQPANSI